MTIAAIPTQTSHSPDTDRLAAMALKSARELWGRGWLSLSTEQRQGAVALAAAHIIGSWEHHEDHPAARLLSAALALVPDA